MSIDQPLKHFITIRASVTSQYTCDMWGSAAQRGDESEIKMLRWPFISPSCLCEHDSCSFPSCNENMQMKYKVVDHKNKLSWRAVTESTHHIHLKTQYFPQLIMWPIFKEQKFYHCRAVARNDSSNQHKFSNAV